MKKSIKSVSLALIIASSIVGCTNQKVDEEIKEEVKEEVKEETIVGYTETKVFIDNGEYKIPAILTVPSNSKDFPIVLMCHGTGSNKDEAGNGYEKYSKKLAEDGIASIRFDFIGTGDSEIDYIDYSWTSAINDVNEVVEYAKTVENVDSDKIGILGWSQGGTVALLASSSNDDIKSVVTWAGAVDYKEDITDELYEEAKNNGYTIKTFGWRDDLKLGLQWYEDVRNTDLMGAINEINSPILAINGDKDVDVLPSEAEMIIENSSNDGSEIYILEGADHTFNIFEEETKFNELCTKTTEWFRNTLNK